MADASRIGPAFRYVPTGLLGGRGHVIVDGAPRPGTVCTLSHWPGTPTPEALWHDVSAGIVLRALARPGSIPDQVAVASIDHYDADGVIALGLLCVEGLAEEHGPLLVEAARVGDFDVVTDRAAALVAFALGALGDVERAAAALDVPAAGGDVVDRTAWAATEALRFLPALVAEPQLPSGACGARRPTPSTRRHAALLRGMGHHRGTPSPRPGHRAGRRQPSRRPPGEVGAAHRCTAAAVHSATDLLRVATLAGGRVEIRYRYESWVRLETPPSPAARRPRRRGHRAHQGGASRGALGLRRRRRAQGALHLAVGA